MVKLTTPRRLIIHTRHKEVHGIQGVSAVGQLRALADERGCSKYFISRENACLAHSGPRVSVCAGGSPLVTALQLYGNYTYGCTVTLTADGIHGIINNCSSFPVPRPPPVPGARRDRSPGRLASRRTGTPLPSSPVGPRRSGPVARRHVDLQSVPYGFIYKIHMMYGIRSVI
jgi:hypothetical protein